MAASWLGAVSAMSVGQAASISCAALAEALTRSPSAARCSSVGWMACWNAFFDPNQADLPLSNYVCKT